MSAPQEQPEQLDGPVDSLVTQAHISQQIAGMHAAHADDTRSHPLRDFAPVVTIISPNPMPFRSFSLASRACRAAAIRGRSRPSSRLSIWKWISSPGR